MFSEKSGNSSAASNRIKITAGDVVNVVVVINVVVVTVESSATPTFTQLPAWKQEISKIRNITGKKNFFEKFWSFEANLGREVQRNDQVSKISETNNIFQKLKKIKEFLSTRRLFD